MIEALDIGDSRQQREELRLAVIAALRGVLSERRIDEFVRLDFEKREAQVACESPCVTDLALGAGIRYSQDSQALLAQDRLGSNSEQGGVDATGIRDEKAAQTFQTNEERVVFVGCVQLDPPGANTEP